MLRVDIRIAPRGSVIHSIDIQNDGTGTHEKGNYDIRIFETGQSLRLENFDRSSGALALVHEVIGLICQ